MIIRKHIDRKNYRTFTERFRLFDALTVEEKVLLQEDYLRFAQVNPDVRLFPDPNFYASSPQKYFLQDAAIISGEDVETISTARHFQQSILQEHGITIPVKTHPDQDVTTDEKPLILIGAARQNSHTRELQKALQISAFNRHFPGENGWGITTIQGVLRQAGPRYVIVCNAGNRDIAVNYFVQNGVDTKAQSELNWLHHVQIDPALPSEYHDFDLWLRQFKHTLEPVTNDWLDSDHSQPYHELFVKVLSPQITEPIIYNAALLDIGLAAIRYYQMTGNQRGLELFLEMLRGCLEYHTTEGVNVYISDMDFRLGQICAYWSWIEKSPQIKEDERQKFMQLMLGLMRIVHDYFVQLWTHREMNSVGALHNHQSFKARALCYGWRYFSQLDVADAENWKKDADDLFSKLDQSRTKYMENAASYESMVPHHALDWHELTRRKVSKEFQQTLASFAMREWVMRDNFFNRVEYGDCAVTFNQIPPLQVALWLDGDNPLFREISALESAGAAKLTPQISSAISSFDGEVDGDENANIEGITTGWTRLELEPKLATSYQLLGESEERFDKLVWKSAWADDGAYVAIEGFGNKTVSHAHNAANSVIRANFGGRVWLVGNGYGKKKNVIAAQEAFSSRQLGPVDHNMLVIRDADGEQILTPMNSILLDYSKTPLPFFVTRVDDYAGCNWTRHLFILANFGLISIDKIMAQNGHSLPEEFSLDWNILGEVQQTPFGALCNQKGVQLHFDHFGTANPEWGFNASVSWHDVLTNNQYPFTSAPLQKCMLHHSQATNISKNLAIFVSGFWIEDALKNAIWNAAEQQLTIETKEHLFTSGNHFASWGKIETNGNFVLIGIDNK